MSNPEMNPKIGILWWVLISVLSHLLLVNAKPRDGHSANRTPIIDTKEETIEQPSGVKWNITCRAKYPIVWKAYDAYLDWTPPNTDNSSFLSDVDATHVSTLIITDTSALTVGWYYCVQLEKSNERDLNEMVTEGYASRVYLFVYDYKQPLVPPRDKSYYLLNDKIVVPCKPSYPEIEPELCNKEGKCLDVFDPTKGFTVFKSSPILSEGGILTCQSDNSSHVFYVAQDNDFQKHDMWDVDHFAGPAKRITFTCTISIVPNERVKVEVNDTTNLQHTDDGDGFQFEAAESEKHYPIAVYLISDISRKLLNTEECEIVELECNVIGRQSNGEHIVLNWYKNGEPVQVGESISVVPGSQAKLSLKGHVQHDDHEVGEYECKRLKLDETMTDILLIETTKSISQVETTDGEVLHSATAYVMVLLAGVVVGACVVLFTYNKYKPAPTKVIAPLEAIDTDTAEAATINSTIDRSLLERQSGPVVYNGTGPLLEPLSPLQ